MSDSDLGTLAATLKRQLPQATEAHLLRLAEMLAVATIPPNPKVIAALIAEGCDPNSLHAAMLFGREMAIERLVRHGGLEPDLLDTTLSRFDRMISILMHHLVEQLESRLSSREQENLLSKAAMTWMREGQIELYNYFMEMPVKARVAVHDVHEQTMAVEKSNELVYTIAAGEHGRCVMTSLPGSRLVLMLEVVSTIGNKVNLKHARIFPQVRERRRFPRVQPEPLLAVTLDITGSGTPEAHALDYSENGMGLILHQRTTLRPGHVIGIDWFTYGKQLRSAAAIRWLQQEEDNTRLGVELTHDDNTKLQLQQMVARAQRNVLGRLRMKGIPDSLL